MSKSPPVVVIDMRRDRPPDDGVEHACWVCLDAHDPHGAAATRTGCACRGSAGYAHLSCLIAAARHKEGSFQARHDAWTQCPTCRQQYLGGMDIKMGRARWNIYRDGAEDGGERLSALAHFSSSLDGSAPAVRRAEALPLREELLATLRRTRGEGHPNSLQAMIAVGSLRDQLGDHAAGAQLLEEALLGCRRAFGADSDETIGCMESLAVAWAKLERHTGARPGAIPYLVLCSAHS